MKSDGLISGDCTTDAARSAESSKPTGTQLDRLVGRISDESFTEWYREREFSRNIRRGKSYFNGPSKIKPPSEHSPSSLLQCHRKTAYRQLNAPEESEDPTGIYWIGSRFEADLALPYLQQAVAGEDEYVSNSLWVDYSIQTDAGEITIRGETDPVIVDGEAKPLLVTEIKSKSSLENLDEPNLHHKAQIHAYMYGLSEDHDRKITESIILYGGRKTLDVRSFHVQFDPCFWRKSVLAWAEQHTTYRLNEELPPANPEYNWECRFCPFKQRCGEGEAEFSDVGPGGLLPGYTDYPRRKVSEYLEAHPEAMLTPMLAFEYPDLAAEHGVHEWKCTVCGSSYPWDEIEWEEQSGSKPMCPTCAERNIPGELRGPPPAEQYSPSSGTGGDQGG